MRAGFKVGRSELDGPRTERHQSQDKMRLTLNALYETGSKTTGSKEFDNVYCAMAQDFGVSGAPDEMTARS